VEPIKRLERSDKLSEHDRIIAEIYWKVSTEVSPNAKDVLELEVSKGSSDSNP
jgi:hypothetical protein